MRKKLPMEVCLIPILFFVLAVYPDDGVFFVVTKN